MSEVKHVCSICEVEFSGYGNNPQPLLEDINQRCCNDCNSYVTATRITTQGIVRILEHRGLGDLFRIMYDRIGKMLQMSYKMKEMDRLSKEMIIQMEKGELE